MFGERHQVVTAKRGSDLINFANPYLYLTSNYLTLNYTFCSLSAYNLLWILHLQTRLKCTNHPSPSWLSITLLFQLPITIQTRASLHSFEFPTITWLWRWLVLKLLKHQSLPTVLLRTPFTWTIKFHRHLQVTFGRNCTTIFSYKA